MFSKFFKNVPPIVKVVVHAFSLAIPAAYAASLKLKADFAYDILHHHPEFGLYYTSAIAVSAFLVEAFLGKSDETK